MIESVTMRDNRSRGIERFRVPGAVFGFGAVLLPRPTSVAADRGRLALKWGRSNRKHQYNPPADLLAQFLSLKNAEQIVTFAGKYGPLHGLTQRHADMA